MERKKTALPLWAILLICSAVLVAGLWLGRLLTGLSQIILLSAFLCVASLIAGLLRIWNRSMARTLYSYTNIALVGTMLFLAVFEIALAVNFIACFRLPDDGIRTVYACVMAFPHQFSIFAAVVILLVSLALGVSNIALIRHEGFRPTNALSLLVALFYLGGTQIIYLLDRILEHWSSPAQNAGVSAPVLILGAVIPPFLLLMLSYFECILAGSAVMGWKAARTVPRYDKDFIIILGCSIDRRGGLLPLLKGRVNRAIRFAWEQEMATGKPLKYVPSGGQGPNEIMSEGSAMAMYLLARGAEEYEVFAEKQSVNTRENFLLSKQIIDEQMPNAKLAFATTNYHILRSGILAREVGLQAEGIAGDTKWYFWPNGFVREFFGILTLKMRSHLIVAVILALLCTALGLTGWLGGLL